MPIDTIIAAITGYAPYYYNPVGAAVGTAAAVATIPFWGWGYPY